MWLNQKMISSICVLSGSLRFSFADPQGEVPGAGDACRARPKLFAFAAYVEMVSSVERRDANVRKVEAASALQLSIILEHLSSSRNKKNKITKQ